MSKNLEDQYKSMIDSDIPDLWSRIEQALPEKTPSNIVYTYNGGAGGSNIVTMNHSSQMKDVYYTNTAKKTKKNKKKKVNYAAWSSLAVACLALLIVIPVAINSSKASKEDSRARGTNTAKTLDIAAPADYMQDEEAEYEAVYEEYDDNDSDMYYESFADSEYSTSTKSEETAADYESINVKQSNDAGASSSATSSLSSITGVVKITCRNEDEEGEVSYNAEITDCSSLQSGTQIIIYSSGGVYDNYEAGQTYGVVLTYVETLADGTLAFML